MLMTSSPLLPSDAWHSYASVVYLSIYNIQVP